MALMRGQLGHTFRQLVLNEIQLNIRANPLPLVSPSHETFSSTDLYQNLQLGMELSERVPTKIVPIDHISTAEE